MIFYEDDRYRYWRSTIFRRHKVLDKATRRTLTPEAGDVEKLGAVFRYLPKIPLGRGTSLRRAEMMTYRLFCMATHGEGEAISLFSAQDAALVAIAIGTMPAS